MSRKSHKSDKKANNKKKKSIVKTIILFLIFEIVFTGITVVPYSLYGPFTNVRNTIISTLMGTGAHKYMAKWFFSDAKIQQILQESNKSETTTKQTKNDVINIKTDSDITRMQLDGDGKFTANVLIIKDPSRVKVGYSSQIGYVGETTRQMAKRYKAVAAINGGYFHDTSPNNNKQSGGVGAIPTGFVMANGQIVFPKDNSTWDQVAPEAQDHVLSIDKSGSLQVGGTYSPNQLIKSNIREAVITEPYIIKNGKNTMQAFGVSGTQPRTAIGQRSDKSIIFMVIDGRQGVKLGATVADVQLLMHKLGAVNAACLDGGGSTAMYYNGEIINNPSNATGERAVPDIIYVEPK
ncbi:phosphodiester glycosidase family protein [Clostridium felsineum]|uniref:Phosphodiester glycosidase domain-containing protein n=1 Tax=Clostridium felsineum TaxID=36839 RepID=A0A1S8MBZ0_9CLOT|nr:phosphodiester glycosidase family protein [Clostridium felsineum]MCR3759497.1 phosphodiester glycosidase family protein [Clostridium felsineum]URZ04180.1 hypothetical protein CLAUR_042680 [Clostridium felsineum]URZ07630.1 hypothetical protein CLROS_029690 [Clostridium felsineum]URZ12661.1 hypothetical protein CROST_033840 [Clostridium felsineum]URZ17304.1 hypothetical protein CLFE_033570 [Clostridium felsineum DSM 794]